MALIYFILYIIIGALILNYIHSKSIDIVDLMLTLVWPFVLIYIFYKTFKNKSANE